MRYRHAPSLATPLLAALLTPIAPAFAQNGAKIEEVTITAEKREESLQNTPIAITALTGETLKQKGITTFAGVAQTTPSITFSPYPSSNNTLILFMRGQGVADAQQITQDGSVGLYVDGIYISRPQAATFDLADVERVEVLRGPQGTLYGRNTTGGAVNIISKKPTGEFGFKQDFTYGSYNQFRSLTTIDLPKLGDVSAKVAYLNSSKDGYVKNAGSGHDFNEEAQRGGRVALRWQPLETFTADYSLEMGRIDSTPIYYQNPSLSGIGLEIVPGIPYYAADHRMSRSYRPIDLSMSDAEYQGHALTLAWDVAEHLTIKSLTGYRDLHSDVYQDYAETFGVPYSTYDKVDSHQFSQEFQFIGSAADERIRYVAGLYYFKESASHDEPLATATGPYALIGTDPDNPLFGFPYLKNREVSANAKSLAAYGQVTWTPPVLADRLDITLGSRFTKDKREATRNLNAAIFSLDGSTPLYVTNNEVGASNSKEYSRFNPALTLSYKWSEDLNTYAKASTGYKAGGSSEANLDFSQTFKPEEVTSYELGLKSYWWDRRVRLNVAGFYSKIKDMQLAFPYNAADPSIVLAYNAGRSTIKGAEFELLVQPIDDLTLSLDYTHMESEITAVHALPNTVFTLPITHTDINMVTTEIYPARYAVGDDISSSFNNSNAPKHSVNAAVDYTFYHFSGGDIGGRLDYKWTSSYYETQPTGPAIAGREQYQQGAYGLLNARLNLSLELPRGDQLRLGVWGKNVLNKQYTNFIIGNPAADVQGGLVYAGYTSQDVSWAEPATYGIDLSYKY